jgi:hypothetical protein
MPAYDFVNERGEPVEAFYPMSGVPSIGATVEHPDHGRITRVAMAAQVSPNHCTGTFPVVSHSLPRGLEGAPHDHRGRPIILSRRHERELCARHDLHRRDD